MTLPSTATARPGFSRSPSQSRSRIPGYRASRFATIWRTLLTPEIATDGQSSFFRIGFEAWLRQKFRSRTRYDKMVFELLTTPIASDPKTAEVVFRNPEAPNALAFFAVDAFPPAFAGLQRKKQLRHEALRFLGMLAAALIHALRVIVGRVEEPPFTRPDAIFEQPIR